MATRELKPGDGVKVKVKRFDAQAGVELWKDETATVVKAHTDGTVDVRFADNVMENVEQNHCTKIPAKPSGFKKRSDVGEGDTVYVKNGFWDEQTGRCYGGNNGRLCTVIRRLPDNSLIVRFRDHDPEEQVAAAEWMAKPPT